MILNCQFPQQRIVQLFRAWRLKAKSQSRPYYSPPSSWELRSSSELTIICCSHNVSRSMLTAETPQVPSAFSGPVHEQAVCFNRCCRYCLLLFIQLLYDFSPISLFALGHACCALNHLWGETSLSLIRKISDFSCICLFCPGCPACFCTALCLRAKHKHAGLTRTSFSYQFLHPLWNGASTWKDRNQISVPLPNLTLLSGWLSFLSVEPLAFVPRTPTVLLLKGEV